MKKTAIRFLVILGLLLFTLVPVASAQFAAGIMIGQPTGLSFLVADRIAVGAAWSLYNHMQFHGDLWLIRESLTDTTDWFLGVGGKAKIFLESDRRHGPMALGARIPIGVRHFVLEPVELFGEIAPGIQIYPSTSPDIDIAIGVRFHFGRTSPN